LDSGKGLVFLAFFFHTEILVFSANNTGFGSYTLGGVSESLKEYEIPTTAGEPRFSLHTLLPTFGAQRYPSL
jgi:hypothetical protein